MAVLAKRNVEYSLKWQNETNIFCSLKSKPSSRGETWIVVFEIGFLNVR